MKQRYLTLAIVLFAAACSSKEKAAAPASNAKAVEVVAKTTEAAKPVEGAKPVEAAKPVDGAKPVEAAKPIEPTAGEAEADATMEKAAEERLMAELDAELAKPCKGSPDAHGICVVQKIANVIDASGTDCDALATKLAPLSKDVKRAIDVLMTEGRQFKTLPLPKKLKAQRTSQAETLKGCESHTAAKDAIKATLGKMKSYDAEYGG
ncbi:MAG: hypothetical protein SFX73_06580 [Kofleriaceae bacterium]|nr:hypothetical protein [Kofleriaceae bacterium]